MTSTFLDTKRLHLRVAAKIYDTAEYIVTFIIRIKLLMQKLLLKGWEEELTKDLNVEFKNWLVQDKKL